MGKRGEVFCVTATTILYFFKCKLKIPTVYNFDLSITKWLGSHSKLCKNINKYKPRILTEKTCDPDADVRSCMGKETSQNISHP